jgi:hypothetical protein
MNFILIHFFGKDYSHSLIQLNESCSDEKEKENNKNDDSIQMHESFLVA